MGGERIGDRSVPEALEAAAGDEHLPVPEDVLDRSRVAFLRRMGRVREETKQMGGKILGDIRRNNPLEAGGKSEGGETPKNQLKIEFLVFASPPPPSQGGVSK